MYKMILATDHIGGIGLNNGIPWHIPEDLQYFKEQTLNCNVIMGRTTYESLGLVNGLPERNNIVLTSHKPDIATNVTFVTHDELLTMLAQENGPLQEKDTWFIGGGFIYEEFIDYVDEVHLTIMPWVCNCDVAMSDRFSDKLTGDFTIMGTEVLTVINNDVIRAFTWRRN